MTAASDFSDFWSILARDAGVPLAKWSPVPGELPPPGAGVLLVAAGGHEAEIVALLSRLSAEIERDLGAALEASGDTAGASAARQRARALYERLGAKHVAERLAALLA